ncbi:HAMP domain-containing histidine kinase [Mucilaginibacter sp. AK015]|uniref:HAMP domain-containing histidine kinase n=1 Tax=Mucilaginibacter sp. AK015 TaxID=2723072 RepID=UPI0016179B80|nr:HAMP domain-containing histidine kinase [Mucilaginibacter sp. AK015]MBB5394713.1 anti-sigma regulatory factor (Ser/Thr protein kinase) [Mucilaginibacter sp. AK015]
MHNASLKKFAFNNLAESLYPSMIDIIDHITNTGKVSDSTVSKLKLVLVEMLTNSLKHSGGGETIIEVAVTGAQIAIKKIDTGNGLTISSNQNLMVWPLPGKHYGNKVITVYTDASAILNARLTNNCRLQFFIEEVTETGPLDINTLTEHFGLMIITRACDTFTYEFDIDTCTNNFTAIINKM